MNPRFTTTIQDAQTTGNGSELICADLSGVQELSLYIVSNGVITAGAIQIEEAHVTGYSGTWSPIGAVVTPVSNSVKVVSITGVHAFIRARITTTITGSSISVIALGRG